ncbi:MAG: TIGR02221 family CRISPR-associated protein [Methylococcaceae bacterium]|nr:MAG: TIGR02221 family CRISPR-associated protein [Methylococcaceae bacterium]
MSHTLISFLGKSLRTDGHYRTATYDFGEGGTQKTSFFSLGLKEVIKPDKLIILGTSGSMWDVLCGELSQDGNDLEALMAAVDTNTVTQVLLDTYQVLISEHLAVDCQLRLISYGDSADGQVQILQAMAKDVKQGEQVSLDVTHGLRHLPMLGLLSAMYLQIAKKVTIEGIYYGAFDLIPKSDINQFAPVLRLDGLLKIADWINALQGLDKTGDIAPFNELLQREGLNSETAGLLKKAAFFENNLNITQARGPLRKFKDETKSKGLPGIASLFEESLKERISWVEQDNIYLRQREKALFYLQQGDYVRASSLGYEALITRHLRQQQPNADIENYDLRAQIKDRLNADGDSDYKLLRDIRNSLAHASRSNKGDVTTVMSSEDDLVKTLNRLFSSLIPNN